MGALKVKNPTTGNWETVALAQPEAIVPSALPVAPSLDTNDSLLGVDGATGEIVQVSTATAKTGLSIPHVPGPVVGEYMSGLCMANQGNLGVTNSMALMPIIIPFPMIADRIWVMVETAAASSVMRLGIYGADALGRPGSLLLEAGTVDSSTTGNKEINIWQALAAGLYYLAVVPQGGNSRYRGTTGSGMVNVNITTVPNNISAPNCQFTHTGSVAGALPATVAIGYTAAGANNVPIIALRRGA